MVVVASKTGWTEEYIRWQLPLSRGWAVYHGARLLEGERCRWPEDQSRISDWLEEVRKKFCKS